MNTKSLNTLEFNKIIAKLVTYAYSDEARAILSNLTPDTDINSVSTALTKTNDALARVYQKGAASFDGIRDVRASLARLRIGSSLNTTELLNISRLLSCAASVANYHEARKDSIMYLFNSLEPVTQLNQLIKKCIISEDEISDDASPNLRDIRRRQAAIDDKVRQELNKILNSPSTRSCLQDYVITTRQGHYCLPVKAEYRSVITGVIHDQSATGSTLFIEPAAVLKLNNDYRELKLQEEAEIESILADLSSKTAEYSDVIALNYEVLTELDCLFAKAQLSCFYHCSRPDINNQGRINIKKGRHPLIDSNTVVPIDIYMGQDFNLLIITGPNTGGKTVSLKTVGLLTLMAQSGLNIPALEHSEIAIFEDIFADIGDEQSIEQSLSTFSSHMTNTVNILNQANERSLILFDEIGAGTDPTEGAALAIAILDDLHKRGITTMATTHYSEIKIYALSTSGVENACCEFDVESLRPTYRLLIGVPGKSNAFAISKKLGLPEYIISNASKQLDAEDIHFEDIVSDLEQSRITIENERKELASYKEEVARLKAELVQKYERLDERTDSIIRKANEEAASILKEAKEYADDTIKTMNKSGMNIKELEKRRSDLRDKISKKQNRLEIKPAKPSTHKSSDISDFKPGMHVRVLSMNIEADVTDVYPNKKQVAVLIGSMSTKVNIKDLEIIDNKSSHKQAATTKVSIASSNSSDTSNNYANGNDNHSSSSRYSGSTGSSSTSKLRMNKSSAVRTEINLLGYTVDEAIATLDKYLDDAYIAKIPQVRIVHGKGTGALRSGITAYLRGVPYIKEFRLGKIGEGDAGVTIVEFK